MGSRLKENPDRTFYWFFEASRPIARDKDPAVLFQFPEDFNDEESHQTLPRFCFPYDIERVRDAVAVQHFTFVLTDLEGCQRFGFCRLTSSSQTCLCMLSYLPWFEVFYKLLNNLADYLTKGQTNEMRELLASLYKQPMPLAVGSVTLQLGEQLLVRTEVPRPLEHTLFPIGQGQEGVPYFIAPDPRALPSIPESRNLTELVVAVDVGNLLQLYASMLFERRILILSNKLSTLTACGHALSAVLYPMFWQHIFIPVLPPHLLDYCCAPMPFLIGVHSSLTERVRSRGLEDVVILNVDTNTLESPFEDLKKIPPDVVSGLKVRLKRQAASPGGGVARAFLRAQALLFGGYRDALQRREDGQICFYEESFLDNRSPSMKQFLQSAVHLQCFKEFVDGRLELLNRGLEPDDLFEEEILQCGTAAGGTKAYQQFVGNLKKGGGALILNVKSNTMYKSAKGLTKRGLRTLLTPKDHNEGHTLHRGGSVSGLHTHRRLQSDCLQSRLPITQHFGQGGAREEESGQENSTLWGADWTDGAASGPVAESDLQEEEEEGGDSVLCDPEEMDLLGEIFDTLSSRSSHERGLLYGTRSLDLFGPDSSDFIRQRCLANPSQESLNASANGSGSLRSWNQEEGLLELGKESEQFEDSDWLCQGHELSEEGTESQGGQGEGQGEVPERGMKERRRSEVVSVEAVVRSECGSHEGRENQGAIAVEKGGREDGREDGRDGGREDGREDGVKLQMEAETGPAQVKRDGAREERHEEEDHQEKERGPEIPKDLPRNRDSRQGTESGTGAGSVADPRGEGDRVNPKSTAPPGLRDDPAAPATKPPVGQETRGEAENEKEEKESHPPRVLSYVAELQSQASKPTLQGKAQTRGSPESSKPRNTSRSWDAIQRGYSHDSNTKVSLNNSAVMSEKPCTEASGPAISTSLVPFLILTPPANDLVEPGKPTEGENTPPVKVSELKKRFEA